MIDREFRVSDYGKVHCTAEVRIFTCEYKLLAIDYRLDSPVTGDFILSCEGGETYTMDKYYSIGEVIPRTDDEKAKDAALAFRSKFP